ncbi:DUF485 domain-containing protein, partial [Streptomyces sp. SID5785]|nr:DUF485 domain-containing protein [Streptomyces sp. SID5785]
MPQPAHAHRRPAYRLPRHPDLPPPGGPAPALRLLRTAYRWQRRV